MWVKQQIEAECHGDGSDGVILKGDSRLIKDALKPYMGKMAAVYMDPPYLTGDRFHYRALLGESGQLKGKPYVTLPAYSDVFDSRESYMALIRGLCETAKTLLSDKGTLFLHLDYRMGAYAKIMLDELMGEKNFVNEIIWVYETGGRATRHFSRKHDVILMYRKTEDAYFDIKAVGMDRKENRRNHMKKQFDQDGRAFSSIKTGGKIYQYYEDQPVFPSDVWTDISHLQQKDPQRTGYDTQKPMKLLERILLCATKKDDWVADLCFGSGTTLVCAADNDRRFLGVDASDSALTVVRKRLIQKAFYLTRQADMSPCELKATIEDGLGFYEITLNQFIFDMDLDITPADTVLQPLDLVDQWSVGLYKDGVLEISDSSVRTNKTPALKGTLQVPMISGQAAIEIIDILSRKHVFVWQD